MNSDIAPGPAIPRKIVGFHQDEERHWVADLECGHTQHVGTTRLGKHDRGSQRKPAGRASSAVRLGAWSVRGA